MTPVSPKRGELLGVVLLAALGAGAGLAYWLNQHLPVVGSAERTAAADGDPGVGRRDGVPLAQRPRSSAATWRVSPWLWWF